MAIRVFLADDSDMMRSAIRRTLEEADGIQVVGEASSFAATMQLIADVKPDVLLFDLHLAEKRHFAPALVKSQLVCVSHVLAVSFSNDHEARDLAESYGAKLLLDKMALFEELVPAIMNCASAEHAAG